MPAFKRIIILGNNGSGKSHFARELSGAIGLPLIHLDAHYWGADWTEPSAEEWREKQAALVAGERWIIDGNHCSTLELRYRVADAVVFLDYSRLTCLMGILRRHGKKRPDMPKGLQDRFDMEFFRFCRRMWAFPKTGRRTILGLHEKYPDTPFFPVGSRGALRNLLAEWVREHEPNLERNGAYHDEIV